MDFKVFWAMGILLLVAVLQLGTNGWGGLGSCSMAQPPMRPHYMAEQNSYEQNASNPAPVPKSPSNESEESLGSDEEESEPASVTAAEQLSEKQKVRTLEDMRRFRRIRIRQARVGYSSAD